MASSGKKAIAWALCAAWMAVIFVMSAMPGDVSGAQSGMVTQLILQALSPVLGPGTAEKTLEFLVRKGAHMAEYAVLFLLYRRALRFGGGKRPGVKAFLMAVAYAATDEFHQAFVPGRGPAAADVMIDAAGAGAAWALAAALSAARRAIEKRRS